MIIKGSTSTGRGLGSYLLKDKNDRVEEWGIRGDIPRDLKETLDDWRSDTLGTRCTRPLYHAQLSPDRTLSRAEWETAIKLYEKEMGFENQPRAIVLHEYKGREHLHIVYSRIDENGKALSDSWNYVHHEKAARAIERELGLTRVKGAFIDREGDRPERAPNHDEMQQNDRLKIDPRMVKAEVGDLYRQHQTGQEFVNALADHGYTLARGDSRAYVILDEAGGVHSLARSAGVKVADLKEKLHDYPAESLPSVEQARENLNQRQPDYSPSLEPDSHDRQPEKGEPTAATTLDPKAPDFIQDLDAPQGTAKEQGTEGMHVGMGAINAAADGVEAIFGSILEGLAGGGKPPPSPEEQKTINENQQRLAYKNALKRYEEMRLDQSRQEEYDKSIGRDIDQGRRK